MRRCLGISMMDCRVGYVSDVVDGFVVSVVRSGMNCRQVYE